MPTVLLAHPGYSSGGPYEAILEKAGFSLRKKPEGSDFFNEEQFREALQGCEAVIAATEPYSRSLMEQTPDLRVIARSGVGYDAVDVSAADVHDIVVTTTPGTNEHSVAEHALAIMMALAMSTIAAMVGAGGLGIEVLRSMGQLQEGQAFIAGSAIVIMAIIIDRITQRIVMTRTE